MALKSWHRVSIALLGMAFFTCLFFLPGSDLPEEDWFSKIIWFDKWVHLGIFCTIIILWSWAVQLFNFKQLATLILLAALYGFIIEIIQGLFIPSRSYDLTDLLADVIGSLIGACIWVAINRHKKNRPL